MEKEEYINKTFLEKFTLSILTNISKTKFNLDNPETIDSDIIVRLSNELMKSISTNEETIEKLSNFNQDIEEKYFNYNKESNNSQQINLMQKTFDLNLQKPQQNFQLNTFLQKNDINIQPTENIFQKPQIPKTQFKPQQINRPTQVMQKYGKIHTLVLDPMISLIRCLGADKQIIIIKGGTQQITNIVLNKEDITYIMEAFSFDSHIPLIEGPFNAQVNNLNITGVWSNMIDSNFVIKRN